MKSGLSRAPPRQPECTLGSIRVKETNVVKVEPSINRPASRKGTSPHRHDARHPGFLWLCLISHLQDDRCGSNTLQEFHAWVNAHKVNIHGQRPYPDVHINASCGRAATSAGDRQIRLERAQGDHEDAVRQHGHQLRRAGTPLARRSKEPGPLPATAGPLAVLGASSWRSVAETPAQV